MCTTCIFFPLTDRTGAFECYPELASYRVPTRPDDLPIRALLHDTEDNQPPSVSYTATQSDVESEEEEEGEEGPLNLTEADQMDWEHLEPSTEETRLFEEEQMKQALSAAVSSNKEELVHRQAQEVEIYRQKLRRLDYNSTYKDYAAMMAATTSSASSLDGAHTMSTNSMGSAGSEEGGNKSPRQQEETTSPLQPLTSGILGTLSSLWTSTFGGSKS